MASIEHDTWHHPLSSGACRKCEHMSGVDVWSMGYVNMTIEVNRCMECQFDLNPLAFNRLAGDLSNGGVCGLI